METKFILARLENEPNEIKVGRRYHARIVHASGKIEHLIKPLRRDQLGRLWFDAHSNIRPRIPLSGGVTFTVELIGRVIATYMLEG